MTAVAAFPSGRASDKGGDFDQAPAGDHPAVLVGLIDLGTHWESFQGQKEKEVRRLLFVFEIEAEIDGKDKRLFVGRDFNASNELDKEGKKTGLLSFHKKSIVRQFLEGWRNKSYADGEPIDVLAVHKQPCILKISEEKTNGGKTVSRVKAASKLPKGMTPLKPSREPFIWSVLSSDAPPAGDWLPRIFGETVADIAKRSLERGGEGRRVSNRPLTDDGEDQSPQADGDSIPF